MTSESIRELYDFSGRTVVLTGGTGVLGSEMARSLAGCNANVVLLARNVARAEQLLESLGGTKGRHKALAADVLNRASVEEAGKLVREKYGRVDCLVNGAGGNDPKATTNPEHRFFDIHRHRFARRHIRETAHKQGTDQNYAALHDCCCFTPRSFS